MHVSATTDAPPATSADTIVVGVFEDEGIAHDHGGVLQALVDSGEAKRGLRKLAVTHAEGKRYIVAGLGARSDFDPERARIAAAGGRVARAGARDQDAVLGGPAPRLRRARRRARRGHAAGGLHATASSRAPTTTTPAASDALLLSAHHDVSAPAAQAATVAAAANRARDLQNRPANVLTPTALAEYAQGLEGVAVEVMDGAAIEAAGMGAFACVAQGSYEDARLITHALRAGRRHRPAARVRRQGRDLRHRRDLDQARGEDARDEVRHVRRRGGDRGRRRRSPRSGCRSASRASSARPRTCRPGARSSRATSCARSRA